MFFTVLRRKSKYLYFILISSPPSVSSSIVNGGTSDLLRISSFSTLISILPVGILGFLDSRSITFPFTFITNSLPSFFTCFISSVSHIDSSKTNCVIPYLSRKSIQIIEPLSRIRCTQPLKTTPLLTFSILN